MFYVLKVIKKYWYGLWKPFSLNLAIGGVFIAFSYWESVLYGFGVFITKFIDSLRISMLKVMVHRIYEEFFFVALLK